MIRNMNSLKLAACALPLFALLLLSGCGVANPVAPTVATAPSSDNLTYQIGGTEEGGGTSLGGGSGSGADPASGGTTQAPRGKKIGHDRHPRPRN